MPTCQRWRLRRSPLARRRRSGRRRVGRSTPRYQRHSNAKRCGRRMRPASATVAGIAESSTPRSVAAALLMRLHRRRHRRSDPACAAPATGCAASTPKCRRLQLPRLETTPALNALNGSLVGTRRRSQQNSNATPGAGSAQRQTPSWVASSELPLMFALHQPPLWCGCSRDRTGRLVTPPRFVSAPGPASVCGVQ